MMIAIRRKSDKVVLYLLPDGTQYELNNRGLHTTKFRAMDIHPGEHEAIHDVPEPPLWVGGALSWDGGWNVTNPEAFEAAETEATERARAEAKVAMVRWIDGFLNRFISVYPQAEVLTWPLQSQAARAFKSNEATTAQTAFLEGLAEKRGITPTQMADIIIAKADPYEAIVQETGALRSGLSNLIDQASYSEIPKILEEGQKQAMAKAAALGVV